MPEYEEKVRIKRVMLPADTNFEGTIFGGVILSEMDLAALEAAREVQRCKFVTKFINEVDFIAPVYVGDTLYVYGDAKKIGNTSVTVHIDVRAVRRETGKKVIVTKAKIVMVAIDDSGKKRPVFPKKEVAK